MRLSVELVPNNEDALLAELTLIKRRFSQVDTINIPDLLRYSIRSWEGCQMARGLFNRTIPHVRAIDINPCTPLPMAEMLQINNITEVLVVAGDPPQDMSRKIYPTTAIDVIRRFKQEVPNVKIYAGIDQYRSSIRKEIEYTKMKLAAGADGFFTQPFFDMRLVNIYAELLQDVEVFWGVSPVTSEKSFNYWETKNSAVFPLSFRPTLEWNIEFAQQVLKYVQETNGNIYFMPIRTNVESYLNAIFN